MIESPKVLVGTPTYEGKDYCLDAFVQNIRKINYPNWNYCIVDNSRKKNYYHKLQRKYPGRVVHVNRGENSRSALANSSNYLRKKALDEGYDYLLMLEVDLFPPKDVIQRLMRHNKKVIGHPYFTGMGDKKRPCIFVVDKQSEQMWGSKWLEAEEWNKYLDGGVHQVHGMGVGCVLIHKSILERFPFYYSSADEVRMADKESRRYPDTYFYLEMHNNGIPVFIDSSVIVPHDHRGYANLVDK